ncbi:isochorismatase family protein [Amycolatopsis sp.]|uniref:isochorismatase family protein n=1 Tax=Amycolatopsis sp. TaxID=37632 RepID=UPI002D7FE911|nr:isochorismatase family protein [Amycolatopsis sp.]HET6711357.1 isochorismatase family protein [Amycolatopsis sp.]
MADAPQITSCPLRADEDLPERLVSWVVHPARAVLLIHDRQRYSLRPFAPALVDPLTKNVVALREYCRATGRPTAHTAQRGRMSDMDRRLPKDFWGPALRGDAADREIVDALTPGPSDWPFTKWYYSAFLRTDGTS